MSITSSIHYFSQKETVNKKTDKTLLGIRGRQANEFAELGLPILPGFIIDSKAASALEGEAVYRTILPYLKKCSALVGKEYGNMENPLLVKLVISPNLAITTYPTLHNFGLTRETIAGFEKWVGKIRRSRSSLLLRGILQFKSNVPNLRNAMLKLRQLPRP